MSLPLLARFSNVLRYNRERGEVQLLDLHQLYDQPEFVAYADYDAVVQAVEQAPLPEIGKALLAVFGLVMAARAWQGRPSDAQRGALIQAGEQLATMLPNLVATQSLISTALAKADQALLSGHNAETVLLSWLNSEISRIDRVAERCGRLAADLLAEDDRVLTHDFPGAALLWMLHINAEQNKPLQLYVTETRADPQSAQLTAQQARTLGIPVTVLSDLGASHFENSLVDVYIGGSTQIALDGAILAPFGSYDQFALARRHGVPRYVLGYDGPQTSLTGQEELHIGQHRNTKPDYGEDTSDPTYEIIPPGWISAIVTNRGIYRPERIGDYLRDGEAPLDVIPLS